VFNVGPLEMVVLICVALIVFGPDKLPQLAKDAARMLRTLRDIAQGARSQLNQELGPEFADFDLRSLHPRTAIKNALLGDDELPNLNRTALRDAVFGEGGTGNPKEALSRILRDDPKPAAPQGGSGSQNGIAQPGQPAQPADGTPYDEDAT